MSKNMLTFTSIEARLKNYGIQLLGIAPDDIEVPCYVPGEDIKTLYGCDPASFMEQYEDNENELFSLFNSVYGISYSD